MGSSRDWSTSDHISSTSVDEEQVDFAFDQWNLQARAQAFTWRREYLQVTRVFDRWCQRAEQDGDMSRRAESYYETQAKSRVLGCFLRFEQESSQMTRLEDRARLYLRATSLLRVFDRTVKRRQDRDKQYVKRYLMAGVISEEETQLLCCS